MYEKVSIIFLFSTSVIFMFLYLFGRRKGTSTDISETGIYQQRAEEDIRGAAEDNRAAAEQNRDIRQEITGAAEDNRAAAEQNKQLRSDCTEAEDLIKRGKEILHME